ncbi:hypothetical protein ABT084_08390 [Streptomyces sp. NPDC002138]|uniref:hypothetical protein n=1 Tax=Streptomyces sp. NPDC002138 TaxID=3154410 RepID=UPI00331DA856
MAAGHNHVLNHLHDEDAVLVADATGGVKKGTHTVAVQRPHPHVEFGELRLGQAGLLTHD